MIIKDVFRKHVAAVRARVAEEGAGGDFPWAPGRTAKEESRRSGCGEMSRGEEKARK